MAFSTSIARCLFRSRSSACSSGIWRRRIASRRVIPSFEEVENAQDKTEVFSKQAMPVSAAANDEKQHPVADFDRTLRYWEQYVEEYVEEADIEGVDDVAEQREFRRMEVERRRREVEERVLAPISTVNLDKLVELLRSHRAKDIFCVAVDPSHFPYNRVLICSPHNARHGRALQLHVRRWIKEQFYFPSTERSGWYSVDFAGACILHIMNDQVRRRYDLERLYTTGGGADENDDDDELTFVKQLGHDEDNEFAIGINQRDQNECRGS